MQGLWNSIIVFMALIICISAQKPFYASGNVYPAVLPHHLPSSTDIDNRFNGNIDTTTDPYAAFEKDPKYNVDKQSIEIIKTYPRDKQPFWYINADQLNNFKGRPQRNETTTAATTGTTPATK
uniref:Uncharacterized protein n=1 Tax=Sipha flava TaxID=143950 RepID=A0A2S2QFH2_9HEMI